MHNLKTSLKALSKDQVSCSESDPESFDEECTWWFLYKSIRLWCCMNINNLRRGMSRATIKTIVFNRFRRRRRRSLSSFLMRMF